MKKIVKLTESDLNRIVSKILTEALDGDVEEFETATEVRDAITNYDKGGVDAKERMKEIQRALKSKGYNLGRSGPNKDGVDGKYGQLTYNAIVDYQRKNGIKRTGWVGKLTSAKLGVEPMVSGTRFLGKPTGGGEVKPPVTTTDPKKQQQINNIYCSVKNGIIKNPNSTFKHTVKPFEEVYNEKIKYKFPVPLKFGFSMCGLGWKTKWDQYDIRHEWDPVISFVFFGYQIAMTVYHEHSSHYWESWVAYEYASDKIKSKQERIDFCRERCPQTWTRLHKDGTRTTTDYWDLILKPKYLK